MYQSHLMRQLQEENLEDVKAGNGPYLHNLFTV